MSLSFFDFIQQQATVSEQSSLATTALRYWQDWQHNRPIDGGVAFETSLRNLPLDGSLVSLAHLDQFLSSLQTHLGDPISEITYQPKLRALLLFISFYSGWVLAYHASQSAFSNPSHPQIHALWLTREQLLHTYPIYQRMMGTDVGHSLAISLLPLDKAAISSVTFSASLYFPLLAIMAQLAPQADDKPNPYMAQFGHLGNSLFDSVNLLLARWRQPSTLDTANQPPIDHTLGRPLTAATEPAHAPPLPMYLLTDLNNPLMERKTSQTDAHLAPTQARPKITYQTYVVPNFANASMMAVSDEGAQAWLDDSATEQPYTPDITAHTNPSTSVTTNQLLAKQQADIVAISEAQAEAQRQADIAQALASPQLHEGLRHQTKSLVDHAPKPQDSFGELEQDLALINFVAPLASDAQAAYQHAVETWQQYYLQQPIATTELTQAYTVIANQACAKMPDAMLRQALIYLRGENTIGIDQDSHQGLALVKAAAQLQDNRAEKLLSKLYFSGELVEMDAEQGKFWLAQAAEHGHAAAQQLQQSFAIVSELSSTRQAEDSYLKKLVIGIGVLVVILLVVMFAVKI